MSVALKFEHNGFSDQEVYEVILHALEREKVQAKARFDFFAQQCALYENKYAMSSDAFLRQFDSGALGDDEVYFDWYAAKRGYDLWKRRHTILSRLSL